MTKSHTNVISAVALRTPRGGRPHNLQYSPEGQSSPLQNCPTVVSSTDVYLQEKKRQKHFINLIPSENFTSQAVLDALGSVMQSQSNIPTYVRCAQLISYQTSIQRVIPVPDTTEEMSTSTSRRGYVNSVPWRPSGSIPKNGA